MGSPRRVGFWSPSVLALLLLLAACGKGSSSAPAPSPPPAAQITLTGTLATGTVAQARALAATSAMAGYQLYCVTFASPPAAASATADTTGAFSLSIAAQGVPLGCFIRDPSGKAAATVEFSSGSTTGTAITLPASTSLGTITVDLGTGLALASSAGGTVAQTPPGAACPGGAWLGAIGPSPTPTCAAGQQDSVRLSVKPAPGGGYLTDLIVGPGNAGSGATPVCGYDALPGLASSWDGARLTVGPFPSGSGTTCSRTITLTLDPDQACQAAATHATFTGCGSCGPGPDFCLGTGTSACGTVTCTADVTLARQYAACTPGRSCALTNPCHVGVEACTTGSPVCTDSGSQPDGTVCGAGLVCSAGTCQAGTRTVAGAFSTTSWTDQAAGGLAMPTTAPAPQAAGTSVAALVPTATGYDLHAGSLLPGGAFTIPGVPASSYLLEVAPPTGPPSYYELTTSTPDLGSQVAGRPDLAFATMPTPVSFSVTGLDPWIRGNAYVGDLLKVVSAQGGASQRPMTLGGAGQPLAGATSFTGVADWSLGADGPGGDGLPEAAKGDVVYVYQLAHGTLGGAVTRNATRYAALGNVTLSNGLAGSISAALGAAPQTGAIDVTDVRLSQFDALASQVNPAATRDAFALSVYGAPVRATFPMPQHGTTHLALVTLDLVGAPAPANASFGTSSYGQFLDPHVFADWRQVVYAFDTSFTAPGATSASPFLSAVWSWAAMSPAPPVTISPALSPPVAPKVNGLDAFTPRTGVGQTPLLSWSPPALGSPTSYLVQVWELQNAAGATSFALVLSATVRGATSSFRVPAGLLAPGQDYLADIAAIHAPWDVTDAPPLQQGAPLDNADCVTAPFTP